MDITADELKQRLDAGEHLHLLDVRDELEYHTFNTGAINIPLGRLATSFDDLEWDRDEEIIVMCKIGLRSNTGKQILQQNGYTNVRNLKGGLIALQRLNTSI
ncbi:rhodanese [Mucilaginibacter sp. PPCGB 2223]|uniref:rhodanese-like domain-containing protein n=1 Tax=Mucilaginibacter sp. PPCGB 2223 TaxID=1886027 RepID=UPI0008260F95|nr:rhodanese-like domain-containing protein [Mucilaginibacter sp. PPCGB 2223]OCX53396.1 rhodanese [Mucilaginibacter sp. PPCGB 2223]